jgi:hypothetical protein
MVREIPTPHCEAPYVASGKNKTIIQTSLHFYDLLLIFCTFVIGIHLILLIIRLFGSSYLVLNRFLFGSHSVLIRFSTRAAGAAQPLFRGYAQAHATNIALPML